jgi:O-antigen/teichoic acid export membrane protein
LNSIKEIYTKMFKSNFAKSIFLIAGGTAFSQAMGILFSPIITRIYPPEQYGVLTAYTSVLGILAIAASLDYQKAIPIAEDDEKAINLLALSIIILSVMVSIITMLILLYGDSFFNILDSKVLVKYKYLIPLGIFFTGMYNIVLQWSFRVRDYKSISRTKINQSITSNFLKVILGLLKIGPIGLVFGTIIGQSAGITTLGMPIIKEKKIVKKIKISQIKKVSKRYIKFPLYSAPSNYVYTAGNQLPIIFLTTLFGKSVVGLYGLANNIVQLPMNLIGMSVSQVFYSEAANIGKSNPVELKRISVKLIKKLSLIALVPLITLLAFGPLLFSFVFGKQWYEAGVYARIISLMIYFQFIILPVGRILEIFERQKEGLIFNIMRLLMILIVFGISKFINLNSYQTIILYTISNSITYVALLFIVNLIFNYEIKNKKEENAIDV